MTEYRAQKKLHLHPIRYYLNNDHFDDINANIWRTYVS